MALMINSSEANVLQGESNFAATHILQGSTPRCKLHMA